MRLASLFSGAGGFEIGFEGSAEFVLLNDVAPDARAVLQSRYPLIRFVDDVRRLEPSDVAGADALVAGFPCQDVSIVGGQRGLAGSRSALVEHVFRLAAATRPKHLLLENVQSIRFVHGGRVLSYLMHAAERLNYAWAYRTLDSRAFGLPQRRRRFYFLASRTLDPGDVLLADNASLPSSEPADPSKPIGFYWTEGRKGHGVTADAIPPLKTGSGVGIPSPPAVLFPDGSVKVPTIETAEQLQGFPPGWTRAAPDRLRWRLVGNAVSPPIVRWIASNMASIRLWDRSTSRPMPEHPVWPFAGWGDGRGLRLAVDMGEGPEHPIVRGLSDTDYDWSDLSDRALRGFVLRAREGGLHFPSGFLERLEARLS